MAITGSATPLRTSGTAPLFVYFDAWATIADGTSNPAHDLLFVWNFNDPGAGQWPDRGQGTLYRDKNYAEGPMAGHLYETAGSYTPTVTITDGVNVTTVTLPTITVTAESATYAGANTILVSPDGSSNSTDYPGATIVTSTDFGATVNTYQNTNRRILFKEDQTFDESLTPNLTNNGPLLIGTWRPVGSTGSGYATVRATADGIRMLPLNNSLVGGLSNFVYRNLKCDPNGHAGVGMLGFIGIGAGLDVAKQCSYIRCIGTAPFTSTEQWNVYSGASAAFDQQICFYESAVTCADGYTHYSAALTKSAFLGCDLSTSATTNLGEGMVRVSGHHGIIMSHNLSTGNQAGRPQHKMSSSAYASSQFLFSCNKSVTGWGVFPFDIAPQDNLHDERLSDAIVERNWWINGGQSFRTVNISARKISIRNNLFDSSNPNPGADNYQVYIQQIGIEPAPNEVWVYNNSGYSSFTDTVRAYRFLFVGPGSTNIVAKNNLASAPNYTTKSMIVDSSGGGLTQSNNTISDVPGWVTSSPSVPNDYKLLSTSIAKDTGTVVAVFNDYFGTPRPLGVAWDIGAAEYTSGAVSLIPNSSSLTISTSAPIVSTTTTQVLVPNTTGVSITSLVPTLFRADTITSGVVSLALSGIAAISRINTNCVLLTGSLGFTGQTGTILDIFNLSPIVGNLQLVPGSPIEGLSNIVFPPTGLEVLSGSVSGVVQGKVLIPQAQNLLLASSAPNWTISSANAINAGILTLEGINPLLNSFGFITTDLGTLKLNGNTPKINLQITEQAQVGTLSLNGSIPEVVIHPPVNIQTETGSLDLTGRASSTFVPVSSQLSIIGTSPNAFITVNRIVVQFGTLDLQGNSPIVVSTQSPPRRGPRVILSIIAPFFKEWF